MPSLPAAAHAAAVTLFSLSPDAIACGSIFQADPGGRFCTYFYAFHEYPGFFTLFGAVITGLVAIYVANTFTKRLKRVDATLEFSKRYHDLMADQPSLNHEDPASLAKWRNWWIRFFDLMYFQYHFYIRGLFLQERFREWMGWRNSEWRESPDPSSMDYPYSYAAGWRYWLEKSRSNHFGLFVVFMNRIHESNNIAEIYLLVLADSFWILRPFRQLIRLLREWRHVFGPRRVAGG